MKLDEAIVQAKQELLNKYTDVVYKGYEVVDMTSNTTTSSYISEKIDVEKIKVIRIENRFKDIEGEIKAIKIIFDVKYPRKRKYNIHEEYFRIIN